MLNPSCHSGLQEYYVHHCICLWNTLTVSFCIENVYSSSILTGLQLLNIQSRWKSKLKNAVSELKSLPNAFLSYSCVFVQGGIVYLASYEPAFLLQFVAVVLWVGGVLHHHFNTHTQNANCGNYSKIFEHTQQSWSSNIHFKGVWFSHKDIQQFWKTFHHE